MAWTEERIALLTKYWQEGHSASQIAEALGEGLTRNAVIGKAHRLGLASRPSPLKGADAGAEAKDGRNRRRVAAPAPAEDPAATTDNGADEAATAAVAEAAPVAPAVPAAPPPAAPAPRRAGRASEKVRRVTLLDLNDRICKWPIGHPDEPDFHFCGKPVSPGFPYCPEHCALAYQAQMPRKDRPAGAPPPFRSPFRPR
jgi:GcrA cell cycle regulator